MVAGNSIRVVAALLAGAALAAPVALQPLAAEPVEETVGPSGRTPASGVAVPAPRLVQFAPAADRYEHRIDYEHWDKALGWFVVPMGPSIREGAPRVDPRTGTRRIYGHESRFRLEGNRVAFSFLTPKIVTALGEYRADLERIGTELDLTRLPRNEQLAYWINLHNVAMIEALAKEYPLSEPEELGLDNTRLVTVDGVALTPRDIRERIVYPGWRDPKVIYGFWRGTIGGPSIQRLAYTGANVDALLALSGEEFVNSLRGVEAWGKSLRVSRIYAEAAPFYFADDAALRSHLATYAGEDVAELIGKNPGTAYNWFESDLADLARGENQMVTTPLSSVYCGGACDANTIGVSDAFAVQTRPNLAIQRLMIERAEKLDRARRRGIRTGMVIYGDGGYSPDAPPVEVE